MANQKIKISGFLEANSLPVIISSLSSAYFFSKFYNSPLNKVFYLILAITVWIIYSLDHFLDAKNNENRSLRHDYFFKRKKLFYSIFILFSSISIYLFFTNFEETGSYIALGIAAFCGIYLTLVHFFKLNKIKDIFISLGFWGATFLIPFYRAEYSELTLNNLYIAFIFLLFIYSSLLVMAKYELEYDRLNQQSNIGIRLGLIGLKKWFDGLVLLTFGLVVLLNIQYAAHTRYLIYAIGIFLGLIGLTLIFNNQRFENNSIYRWAVDLCYVFLAVMAWFFL